MTEPDPPGSADLRVEDEFHLTFAQLCRVCRLAEEDVQAWVVEGVLEPIGDRPEEWRFAGSSLRRAWIALRLSQDLQVNVAGIALALDLLDQIATLKTGHKELDPNDDPQPPNLAD